MICIMAVLCIQWMIIAKIMNGFCKEESMVIKRVFLFLFTLTVFTPAYAAKGYVGFGLGQSEINQGLFGEYGDGFKVFGGVRLHPHLAVEAAYLDFGKPSQNLFGIETKYEAWAAAAWAKGLWPVGRTIELFAKAGWAHWEVDATTTLFGSTPSKTSSDGNDFAWGLGIAFNKWEKFSLQLEYEDINSKLDTITLWSVSGIYAF